MWYKILPLKKNRHEQYACAQMSAVHLQLMHPILSCKFNHKYEGSYQLIPISIIVTKSLREKCLTSIANEVIFNKTKFCHQNKAYD